MCGTLTPSYLFLLSNFGSLVASRLFIGTKGVSAFINHLSRAGQLLASYALLVFRRLPHIDVGDSDLIFIC